MAGTRRTSKTRKRPQGSQSGQASRLINVNIEQPAAPELRSAYAILEEGLSSVNSLATLYSLVTKVRGRGAPKHEEQDLLRAMLVMAGAALDATLKRLLSDAFSAIAVRNDSARRKAAEHLYRQVLKRIENNGERFALALLDDNLRSSLVKLVVDDLTGQSLQSIEQIQKVVAYLGLESSVLSEDELEKTRKALKARNQIVHEMDAVLQEKVERGGRKRYQRKKREMHGHAQILVSIGAKILSRVDNLLKGEGS